MRKNLLELTGILAAALVLSCQSTGNASASGGQTVPSDTAGSFTADSADEQALSNIYERYESRVILTGATFYTVAKGDTLSRIARQNYGAGDNPYYFPLIIVASKDSADIVDPDSIEVGMRLVIPSLQKNLDDPAARQNLKNMLKDVADFYAAKNGPQSRGLYDGLIKLYNTL
jgi:LysM repeat protein